MTLFKKLFLQGFSRRIFNSCRVPSPVQGWAVRCLYYSITRSQKTFNTRASLLKMQKSLQGHLSFVWLRDISGLWGISNEERSKCSCVAVKGIGCLCWSTRPAHETMNIFSQATRSQLQPHESHIQTKRPHRAHWGNVPVPKSLAMVHLLME